MQPINDEPPPPTEQGRFRRVRALLIKESYQIIRDPSTLLISVVLPLLLLFLYGYGVSLDLDHLRIGLVMEDTAPDAQRLAKSFTNSRYFDVDIVRDRRELTKKIEAGKIRGFVVIPSYFTDFRNRPDRIAPFRRLQMGVKPIRLTFFNTMSKEPLQIGYSKRGSGKI